VILITAFQNLDDLDCRGRRVFFRVDPLVLAASAAPGSSLRELLEREARIVIGTQLSTEDAADTGVSSLDELTSRLSAELGVEAFLPEECTGDAVVRILHQLRPGQLCVLPDLGREPAERSNDERFARALASNADAYLGDAFATSHLELASQVRLPQLLPRRALGVAARRELGALGELLAAPRARVGWCVGGRRLADKLDLLDRCLPRLSLLCVGGLASTTLLAALGRVPESASAEPELLARCRSLIARCRDLDVELLLPTDLSIVWEGDPEPRVIPTRSLFERARVVDVGPESTAAFCQALRTRQHLVWWGATGDLANTGGTESSQKLVELCASGSSTAAAGGVAAVDPSGPRSVIIGRETTRYVRSLPEERRQGIELISGGTAAARTLLAGYKLPGIEALRRRG
jgi:phosphoglycerate kinase